MRFQMRYAKESIYRFVPIILLFVTLHVVAQTVERDTPPELGKTPSLEVPEVKSFKMDNGLTVYIIEKKDLPIVQFRWTFFGSYHLDPVGKEGLASITASMLDEGAAGMDALTIADEIDYLGINISSGSSGESNSFSLFSTSSKLEQAIALSAKVMLQPDFPQKELERLKKSRLNTLLQRYDQGGPISREALKKYLFAPEHPYGRTGFGTEKSIKSITREDLQNFYSKYYTPENAFLVVVGNIDKDDLKSKLNKNFSSWKGGEKVEIEVDDQPQVKGLSIILVDRPGAAQSNIRIGRIGAKRDTDDYFAIQVMNTILGGSFTSRLNQNIREEHGYAYGAGSGFQLRLGKGAFLAASAVQSDVTDKALSEFFNEFRDIRVPIPEGELQRAKNYLALSYPSEFSSIQALSGKVVNQVFNDLDEDFINSYIHNILAVNQSEVEAAAKKYVDPQNLVIIIVGDREKIEKGIRDLNLGDIKNVTIEDILGPKPEM